jgi:hypothetical protein
MDDLQLIKILRNRIKFAVDQLSVISAQTTDRKIKKIAEDTVAELSEEEDVESTSVSPEE